LSFLASPKRARVTIESQHYGVVLNAGFALVERDLATKWIVEMFATSLLGGLREGEVLGLLTTRLDFKKGIIVVDRALRKNAQDVDKDGLPVGPIKRVALGLPKSDKTRIVPMSDQLASILKPIWEEVGGSKEERFLWPNSKNGMKEVTRFHRAFATLRKRFDLMAKLKDDRWERFNELVEEMRSDKSIRLPDRFGAIDFRDTRNSFASFTNEVRLAQATREAVMGHAKGVTNVSYTDLTAKAVADARRRLTAGWQWEKAK
jgi:integrase